MRVIDADALIAWIKGSQQMTSKMKCVIAKIETMPDAVSVVHGEWKPFDLKWGRSIAMPFLDIVWCEECKHKLICSHSVQHTTHEPTSVTIGYKSVDYCSYGERREP